MIQIRELPCLWRAGKKPAGPAGLRVQKYLPWARRADPEDLSGQAEMLEAMDGDWILVLDEDVLPFPHLPYVLLEPSLLGSDRAFAYLTRNAVTEEFEIGHGPEVWPRAAFLEQLTSGVRPVRPEIVAPQALAQWYCNPDPETTLVNGHRSMLSHLARNRKPAEVRRIRLRGSIGAEVGFGYHWIIGCCHALLGEQRTEHVIVAERDTPQEPEVLARRARALARSVRLTTEHDLQVLDPAESRMIKKTAFRAPPASVYHAFADALADSGDEAADVSGLYREAAGWLWGARA